MPAAAASHPPTFSVASIIPGGQGDPFDLSTVSGMATAAPPWPAAGGTATAEGTAAAPEQQPEPDRPDSAAAEPKEPASAAPPSRSSARSPNVVNDAMIASIRRRLKLTAEQEKLWPPVEAALRKIVYTRAALTSRHGRAGATAYIDPDSPEVQELKVAALPLLMRLNEAQKREVRELAYVMGLQAVASQF